MATINQQFSFAVFLVDISDFISKTIYFPMSKTVSSLLC